jgi:hypothetical protein
MTSRKVRKRILVAPLAIAAIAGADARVAQGDGALDNTLTLRSEIHIVYPSADCPTGTPTLFECFVRSGDAIVPGLGPVQESYAYSVENAPAGCTAPPGADAVRLPPATARLTVAGKGEIKVATSGTGCLFRSGSLRASEPFTITGGTGIYAGASGSGIVTTLSFGPPAWAGIDTWAGTFVVPGLRFDLTAPAINGAVNKRVRVARRVKRVRVTYAVTALDDVDGAVAATCSPRSGSAFPVGRTSVTCSAADTSGNLSRASFTVTVTRKR